MNARTPQNWKTWATYFERNAVNQMDIDWQDSTRLSPTERQTITRSIQQFQLGESSEGKHLIAQAQHYAEVSGDEAYVPVLRLFIKEEQRHSQYLGRFMEQQGLPLSQSNPVDSVFRFLRRAFTLEMSIMAMLTAEIIAVPYYKSLHDATQSPLLRQICRQLLRDEMQHLQFQLEALHSLDENRSLLVSSIMRMLHRILFTGTVLIVWQQHTPVLRAGGYSSLKFWQASWQHFNRLFAKRKAIADEVTLGQG